MRLSVFLSEGPATTGAAAGAGPIAVALPSYVAVSFINLDFVSGAGPGELALCR